VVTTTTHRSEKNGWITGGEYREVMEGEAKQLEGNRDGKLLHFERLIYQVLQNSLNTLSDSGADTKLCETVRETFRNVSDSVYVEDTIIFGQSIR
jgi:hypothetical protein